MWWYSYTIIIIHKWIWKCQIFCNNCKNKFGQIYVTVKNNPTHFYIYVQILSFIVLIYQANQYDLTAVVFI